MCYETEIKEIQPQLKRYVKSKVFRPQDAEDIVQNTNIILINKENQYDKSKNFKAWVLTIASWQIKRYLTDVKRCKIILAPNNESYSSFLEVDDVSNSPSLIIEKKEHNDTILNKICSSKKCLSEKQLTVLELISLGWKQKDIAKYLNISISSVGSVKRRAINKLKKLTGHLKLTDDSP